MYALASSVVRLRRFGFCSACASWSPMSISEMSFMFVLTWWSWIWESDPTLMILFWFWFFPNSVVDDETFKIPSPPDFKFESGVDVAMYNITVEIAIINIVMEMTMHWTRLNFFFFMDVLFLCIGREWEWGFIIFLLFGTLALVFVPRLIGSSSFREEGSTLLRRCMLYLRFLFSRQIYLGLSN